MISEMKEHLLSYHNSEVTRSQNKIEEQEAALVEFKNKFELCNSKEFFEKINSERLRLRDEYLKYFDFDNFDIVAKLDNSFYERKSISFTVELSDRLVELAIGRRITDIWSIRVGEIHTHDFDYRKMELPVQVFLKEDIENVLIRDMRNRL